ncbi:hypothetical protein T12_4755 [Trichinella patagoniensis]|uniref:Uncharacterized protein n=1 Tax=Trichinella patagoniensis TaxID=990121 RepID=A0A0V0X0W8_9BILA|nr:hypothetical protein T12_4755 [Trichinella patagoniensis]
MDLGRRSICDKIPSVLAICSEEPACYCRLPPE